MADRTRSLGMLAAATALSVPWVYVWATNSVKPMATLPTVGVSGLAVLGASFLLAWAAETAEKDVPQSFAIAVLAVLAVAPEYAVDALYAWEAGVYAGAERGIEAGNLAVANMTGANRILIGIGWSGIALFTIMRARATGDQAVDWRDGFLASVVTLDRDIGLEIVFLFAATVWAFLVPLNGGIDALDTLILVGLYATYIFVVLRGDVDPIDEHVGVPAYLQTFRRPLRIATVVLLFAYSGFLILTAVEPFAHGLEELGVQFGIPAFFMIQWIAPLASESPELIVVAYLVNKARSTAGFNTLISSKLNQWTLLIGTLVVVYSIALGHYGTLPFDQKQAGEIWLTAAQSFFALTLLINFEISAREALVLFVLFITQVFIEFLIVRELVNFPLTDYQFLLVFSVIYLVLGAWLLLRRWTAFRTLLSRVSDTVGEAFWLGDRQPERAD